MSQGSTEIDPQSVAGALLREHETPQKAHKHAKRMANEADNPVVASEYAEAAAQLKRYIESASR